MAQRKQLTWTELRVGLFVLVGLSVLAAGIFYVTGSNLIGPKYRLVTYLPEVSGLEVTQWLKNDAELRHIPVVAITAFAMKGDEEKILRGGCEAYLSKPISVAKFFETIDHFLGTPPKA